MEISILVHEDFDSAADVVRLRDTALRTIAAEGADPRAEMGLVVTGQEDIQRLNRDYRGVDEPTDVLSFQMGGSPAFVTPPDGVVHLGEVIVSYPQAVVQAHEHGHSVAEELDILVVHGVLHLLGYDHEDPEDERRMRAREAQILARPGGQV